MNSLRFDVHFGMLTALKHACMMVGIVAFLVGCEGGSGGGSKSEQINGIAVPPVPDSTANLATVSGVDSNSNGIRDDVDRALATEFGQGAAAYQEAATFARTLQAALVNPGPLTIENHIALLRCVSDSKKLADLQKITLATLDAPIRKNAYATTFAGVLISSRGCPK